MQKTQIAVSDAATCKKFGKFVTIEVPQNWAELLKLVPEDWAWKNTALARLIVRIQDDVLRPEIRALREAGHSEEHIRDSIVKLAAETADVYAALTEERKRGGPRVKTIKAKPGQTSFTKSELEAMGIKVI